MSIIVVNPEPKFNVDILDESSEYTIEMRPTTSVCELYVYTSGSALGGGGGGFNPAIDYTITGNWTFTQPINTTNDGNSQQWALAYDHSLIVTGNPHALDLADIGETYATINYWELDSGNVKRTSGKASIGVISQLETLNVGGNILSNGQLQLYTANDTARAKIYAEADGFSNQIGLSIDTSDIVGAIKLHYLGGVGINTDSHTDAILHTKTKTSSGWGLMTDSNALNNSGLYFGTNDASLYLKKADGTLNILLNSNGDSYIKGGYLAIGHDSPTSILHAKEDLAGETILEIQNTNAAAVTMLRLTSSGDSLEFVNIGPSGSYGGLTDTAMLRVNNGVSGGLLFQVDTSLGSEGIRFQNTIGTTLFQIEGGVPRFLASTIFEERVGTDTFSSGFAGTGWEVKDYTISGPKRYTATFDNLSIRRTMKVYELEINKIRASNGSLWVSDAMEAEYAESYLSGWKIKVLDELDMPFLANDIVRTQKWTGDGIKFWQGIVQSTGTESIDGETYGWAYVTEYPSGSGYTDTPENGDTYVRVDNDVNADRKGALYLTSSDVGSPFIDVVYGMETDPVTGVKVRIGKLDGITDTEAGLDGSETNLFGLYGQNVHLKGHIFAQTGNIGGWNLADYKMWAGVEWNGDGALTVDSGVELDATNLQILLFKDGDNFINNQYVNDDLWGFNGYTNGELKFFLGKNSSLGIDGGYIAGWYFDEEQITNTLDDRYIYLKSTESVTDVRSSYGLTFYFDNIALPTTTQATKIIQLGQLGAQDSIDTYSTDYGFRILAKEANTNTYKDVMRADSNGAMIAGWTFDDTTLRKDISGVEVWAGEDPYNSSLTGFGVSRDSNNFVRMIQTSSFFNLEGYYAGNQIFSLNSGGSSQIAGWSFTDTTLGKTDGDNRITMYSDTGSGYPSIYARNVNASNNVGVGMGQLYYNGVFQDEFGFALAPSRLSTPYFQISKNLTSGALTAKIGSWNIGAGSLSIGNISLDATNNRVNIEGPDTGDYVRMYYTSDGDWGLSGYDNGSKVFGLGDSNYIAGFTFDNSKISGTGIEINASGSIKLTGSGVTQFKGDTTQASWFTDGDAQVATLTASTSIAGLSNVLWLYGWSGGGVYISSANTAARFVNTMKTNLLADVSMTDSVIMSGTGTWTGLGEPTYTSGTAYIVRRDFDGFDRNYVCLAP